MGYGALIKNTTGFTNVAIGHGACKDLTTGSNNVCIGFNSTCSGVAATNEINLGNGASGTVIRAGTGTIAQISDERDKTDVVDLAWGLDFVDKLRPVQFTWDRRVLTPNDVNHGSNGKKAAGFLAQDFQRAMNEGDNEILDLVYEVNPERIEAKYGSLIPMLTQAIKDLKAQNEALMARVSALENKN